MPTNLPTDIDSTYPDDGAPGRKLHQQYHDQSHAYTNTHDGAVDPHPGYLRKADNLAALADKAAARTNLAVQSTTEANAAYIAKGDVVYDEALGSAGTTSTTYTDLFAADPEVTVTIGSSGRALVILSVHAYCDAAGSYALASFAVSGATARAAADGKAATVQGTAEQSPTLVTVETGLTAGSTTFTTKYRATAGTVTFNSRRLTVIPL